MEQGREATRTSQWDEALKNAVRALQEFPQDGEARTAAAVALFQTGKLDRALQIFEEQRATDPQNPFFLTYIAQAHARQGSSHAIESYKLLADLHAAQKRPAQAVEALRELLRLRPEADDQRARLAKLYEEMGASRDAAAEHILLAQAAFAAISLDKAAQAAETAMRLDPNSREAKELLISVRDAMARAAGLESAPQPSAGAAASPELRVNMAGMTGALRSQQFQVEKLVEQAQKKQEAGDVDGAAVLYEQAVEAGLERADVLYSLGLIYQERADHKGAVGVLTRAASDPEYALSAHFALGQSYKELGQLAQAAQEFEQTIRLVDLESIGKAEADDLIQMYDNAATIFAQIGDIARAGALYGALASFLESKRWGRERAAEFKQRSKELTERNMFAKLRTLGTGALTPQPEPDRQSEPLEEPMSESWGKIRPITDFLRGDRIPTTGNLGAKAPTPLPEVLISLESLPAPKAHSFAPATPLATVGLGDEERDAARAAVRIEHHPHATILVTPAAADARDRRTSGQRRLLAVGPTEGLAVGLEDHLLLHAAADGPLPQAPHDRSEIARPAADLARPPAARDAGREETARNRDDHQHDDQLEEREPALTRTGAAGGTTQHERQPAQLARSRASPSPPGAPSAP